MCGRYTQTADLKTLKARFGFSAAPAVLKPRYNLAPTQDAPVVVEEDGRRLELFHWGLIPSWAKDPAIGHKLINARAETLLDKPSFKKPFQRSRCLVLADGFYEWRELPGGGKTPLRVVRPSREPFAMAGLWDRWKAPDGTQVRSFAIITAPANELLKPIHDRMPVILEKKSEAEWLDPAARLDRLAALLRPSPESLEAYEVSALVNSPAHEDPGCVEPPR